MSDEDRAKRNAAYQRAYRARHVKGADSELARLSVLVSVQAKAQLERLARRDGASQRTVIERLLQQASGEP